MHAFVTGATGFIGSNLVRKLKKLGWKVNVLLRDKSLPGRISNVKSLKIYEGDLSDKKLLGSASKDTDVIINCAAALPYHKLSDKAYIKANVDGLRNILEVARARKVRLVHLSTVGIYGPTAADGINEEASLNPQDIYAKTKVQGEELIKLYENRYGVKVVIIRPTIAYGPGDTRPGFLNLFKLIKKGIFVPIGSGENYFHTIYIDNLLGALILAATKEGVEGNDFIIGDEPAPKMKQIINSISKILGRNTLPFYIPKPLGFLIGRFFDLCERWDFPAILPTQRVKFLTESKRYKINKAKEVLGYRPRISLNEGLKRTHLWYKENGYL